MSASEFVIIVFFCVLIISEWLKKDKRKSGEDRREYAKGRIFDYSYYLCCTVLIDLVFYHQLDFKLGVILWIVIFVIYIMYFVFFYHSRN